MTKHASDLSIDELARLGAEAAQDAVRATHAAGLPTVGVSGRQIVRTWPDGRTEVIGIVGENTSKDEPAVGVPFRVA